MIKPLLPGLIAQPRFRAAALSAVALGMILTDAPLAAQTRITGAQIHNPIPPVAALPANCTPYSVYFLTTTSTPYICTSLNTFTPLATAGGGTSSLPSAAGAGYLYTDGSTVSWGNLVTGGSGVLDCTSTPGQCDVTDIVPLKAAANTWTGANDFHSGLFRLPSTTVALLPAAPANAGREFMITDGASICDFTSGGGSYQVFVKANEDGSGYVAPNCGGSGGGGGGTLPTNPNILSVVTALGDSLTRGWGATSASTAYPFVLMQNTGLNVINISIGGYDSGSISTWVAGQTAAQKAGLWVIWAGRNDITTSAWNGIAPTNSQTTVTNIATITSAITAAGGDYIVMSVINACVGQEYPGGTLATAYNNIIANNATLAATYGSRYLDIRAALVARDNGGGHDCPGSSITATGVHLNDAGYALVATTVAAKIQTLFGGLTPNIGAVTRVTRLQSPNFTVTVTGPGNWPTITTFPPVDATDGRMFCFSASAANTGAVSVTFNGVIGTIPIVKTAGAALVSGDITTGVKPCVVYHLTGTSGQFELLNPQTVASSGGGGGGGGSFAVTLAPNQNITMTGSDVQIYSVTSVPALPAGQCYNLSLVIGKPVSPGFDLYLYVDGSSVSKINNGLSLTETIVWGGDFKYCNNSGVQNAQTLVDGLLDRYSTGWASGSADGQPHMYTFATGMQTPTAVDMSSSSHTFEIKARAASGVLNAYFFRIGQ